jgi:hypothetical protein
LKDDERMNLSESIIKIHSIATENIGELEADEFVTSLLVLTINDLKKNGDLKAANLEDAFRKKCVEVLSAHLFNFEPSTSSLKPHLYLVSN